MAVTDQDSRPVTDVSSRQPRASRWLIATSIGLALGAVGLTGYAYTIRIPHGGRAPDTLGPVGSFFMWFLILAVITTAFMMWTGWVALAGRSTWRHAAAALAGTVALTGYAYINSTPSSVAERISGPGARPAVELAQLAWPVLALAALLLLIGVAWAAGTASSPLRAALALLSPLTAVGLVVSLVAGLAVATWWQRGQVHAATVDPIAVAPYPTTVGSTVAYSMRVTDAHRVVPAGPGFVVFDKGGALSAYDGSTGARRWSVAPEVFPDNCQLQTVRATGTAADSVVVAECVRPQLHPLPANSKDDDHREAVLLGFDANTGRLLWLNDQNFALASYGAGQSATLLAVTRRGEIGSLDPRTGAVRWTKPGADSPCEENADIVNGDIVIVPCYRRVDLRVLDGMTGDERIIALPISPPMNPSGLRIFTLAADGDLLVLGTRRQRYRSGDERPTNEYGTLAVDIASGAVVSVPSAETDGPDSPLPGPLLQLGFGGRTGETFNEVYSLPQRRLLRIDGLVVYASVGDGQLWATIGDKLVTAAARDQDENSLAVVGADGSVTRLPLPCPPTVRPRGAGIMPVPGATLLLCPPADNGTAGWDVLGLR